MQGTASAAPSSAAPAPAATIKEEDAAAAPAASVSQDVAKERRATRKAAAACLARQRHKSFVSNLQDQGALLRGRIEGLKRRRGHAVRPARRPLTPPPPGAPSTARAPDGHADPL